MRTSAEWCRSVSPTAVGVGAGEYPGSGAVVTREIRVGDRVEQRVDAAVSGDGDGDGRRRLILGRCRERRELLDVGVVGDEVRWRRRRLWRERRRVREEPDGGSVARDVRIRTLPSPFILLAVTEAS